MQSKDPALRDWRLTLRRIHDILNPHAHLGVELYLAWAGSLPYGNAKAVTVYGILRWFREMKSRGFFKDVDIIVEATSGNTGLVMVYMILTDPSFGIKIVRLVVKNSLPEAKKTVLTIGGAHVIPATEGLTTVATARQMGGGGWLSDGLTANGNVLNFDQYGHPAGPAIHCEFTGPAILHDMQTQFGIKPNQFIGGAGSGGTVLGVDESLRNALDGEIGTTGVVLAPEQEAPGMRTYEEIASEITLPLFDLLGMPGNHLIEAWTRPSYLAATWLARVTGCPVGPSTGACYMGHIDSMNRQIADGSINRFIDKKTGKVRCVIFGSDGNAAYTDRFAAHLPFETWEKRGKMPLPWEWNWRGDLPAARVIL